MLRYDELVFDGAPTSAWPARAASTLDPQNPPGYPVLGLALTALGDYAGAAAAHRKQIELRPAAAAGYVLTARSQLKARDAAGALQTLIVGDELLRDDAAPNLKADAAYTYTRLGRTADAARLLERFAASTAGIRVDRGNGASCGRALRRGASRAPRNMRGVPSRHGSDARAVHRVQRVERCGARGHRSFAICVRG